MQSILKPVGTGIAALAMAASAHASYIVNGDFEDGLVGWNDSPIGAGVSIVNLDGNNVVKLDDPDSFGVEWIYQSFYIPSGVTEIEVSFSYRFDSVNDSWLMEDWAGGQLFTLGTGLGDWLIGRELFSTSEHSNGWVSFSGVYDVSGIWDYNPNARIVFGLQETWAGLWWDSTDSALYLDNISVTRAGDYAAVPEPGSLGLLGLAMVALGVARRRR